MATINASLNKHNSTQFIFKSRKLIFPSVYGHRYLEIKDYILIIKMMFMIILIWSKFQTAIISPNIWYHK